MVTATALSNDLNMNSNRQFKESEVGNIPPDWDARPLFAIADMKSGEGITARDINDHSQHPCYGGNGLRGFTSTYTHDGTYALVGRQGALCGNVCIASGKFFASEHAIVVAPKEETEVRWLGYVLTGLHLNNYSESSAQPGLSVEKIKKLIVATPPTKIEQGAIANALSDADALIESQETLIAKKRAIKKGALQQLLDPGPDWTESELRELCHFENGDRGVNYPSKLDLVRSGYPFVNAGHLRNGRIDQNKLDYITKEKFDQLGSGKLRPDDILFCLRGTLGKYALVGNNVPTGAIASSLIIIRSISNKIDIRFLHYYFQSHHCARMIELWSGGAAQPNLGGQDLARFSVFLPKSMDQQLAISATLTSLDDEIELLEAKLEKMRQIKQGMMQELLTGRVRLV